MNKHFKSIKNKEKFKNWLIRQYFNEEKNINKPWFDHSVNNTNVLEYISESRNNFPLTPIQLVDMWGCINFLKKKIKNSQKEINEYYQIVKNKEKNNTEYTLEDIGDQLGGITATMINRLSNSGMDKFKILTYSKHFDQMSEEEISLFNQGIDRFRKQATEKYIELLKTSKGDLNVFFDALLKDQVLTKKELELLQPEEYDVILQLYTMTEQEAEIFLLMDIEKDNNVVKSFQSMMSRQAFPTKKRGRPKKVS